MTLISRVVQDHSVSHIPHSGNLSSISAIVVFLIKKLHQNISIKYGFHCIFYFFLVLFLEPILTFQILSSVYKSICFISLFWFDFINHAFLVLNLSNIPFTPPDNNPSLQFFLWFVTFRNEIISNTNCSWFPRAKSYLSGQRYICLHVGALMDCYGLGKISIPWRVLYIKLLVSRVTGRCCGPLKCGGW